MLNMLLMLDTTNNYIIVRQKNLQSFMQFLIIFFWGVAGGRGGGVGECDGFTQYMGL